MPAFLPVYRVREGTIRMNLVNILTGRDPLKRAFVTLEDGMTDVLNEEFMLPAHDDLPPLDNMVEAEEIYDADGQRLTGHAQSRLASHAAFAEARNRANEELARIGQAINHILASQNVMREFTEDALADIHRANELELAHSATSAENRRMNERVEKLERLRVRYDQLIDVLKRREAKLIQEGEDLREELGALKLETLEARSHASRGDAAVAELQATLAARTGEAERNMRDAEVLREKNVALTLELDQAQKKHAEMRRRLEELTSAHAEDSARLSEATTRLASEESENQRLQALTDTLEARLVEASDKAARLSSELADQERRHHSEAQALRAEVQSLSGRLQASSADHRETLAELGEMRSRLSDAEAQKTILQKKHAAISAELENERRMYIAHAGLPAQTREAPTSVREPAAPKAVASAAPSQVAKPREPSMEEPASIESADPMQFDLTALHERASRLRSDGFQSMPRPRSGDEAAPVRTSTRALARTA